MSDLAVAELWRYPVKSLLGERLDEVDVEERGVVGDRLYAVTDRAGKLGSGKTTTRFRLLPGLFELRAQGLDPPVVTLPDGRELPVGAAELDAFLGERYGDVLTVARETTVMHHDGAPLHLLTTASLRWLAGELPGAQVDRRRFRPNLLVEAAGSERAEEAWVGRRVEVGGVVLRVRERTERCVMTTNAQDDLGQDPRILRALTELNDICIGVYADVERPGRVRVGDTLRLLS